MISTIVVLFLLKCIFAPHGIKTTTYYKGSDVLDLPGNNFSPKELFLLYVATFLYTYIYSSYSRTKTLAKILVVIRKHQSLIPFSILNR